MEIEDRVNLTRDTLYQVMQRDALSLRDVEELTGVSFSTISRFLNRTTEPTLKNLRRIEAWLIGEPIKKQKPLIARRFTVNKRTFLVTIEDVTAEEE